ncbi:glycosyltransferase family 4 protein [uncultured Christiangramia sp.]|uniref:glycosyltransferase family 4 protein n=1 Tax=uncultured Christiangramia sp. TaxID=503836 RepID=UPI0026373EA1|nr:glycosyltransferase family 4 protein [uncultured Christiangramia sp.]
MKVIILINSLGAGGAERSMVEYAKFLQDRDDIMVKFVCLAHKKIGLEAEVKNYGIETIFYESKSGFFAKLKFLNTVINSENPDIIHSVLAESNILMRFSRLFVRKGKVIQSLVNTPYSEERKKDSNLSWQKFQVMKALDKWSARLSPNLFYHAITNEVLQHYRPLYNIKDNFEVIYRGRDSNPYLNEVTKNTRFTIINSGRQEFAKGQIDILKALVYLEEKYNITNIHLQILGRPGSYSSRLMGYIKENNINDRVELFGFVDDVEKRLAKANVFVFPSYYEGLGGALIEAFSAKLPCAVSNIAVLREVVGSEDGALYSSPGDHKTLANNIYELYKTESLREKLGSYSLSRFQDAFKLNSINFQMLKMYHNIEK